MQKNVHFLAWRTSPAAQTKPKNCFKASDNDMSHYRTQEADPKGQLPLYLL